MDSRLEDAPVVLAFAKALEGVVEGLYVAGSLATADYRPGVSDIDAVALVARVPTPATRAELVEVHQRLAREVKGGTALHCFYVPSGDVADGGRKHWTWASDELFRRPLSGIARAELLADPIVVAGPAPSDRLPPMDIEDVRAAVRAELAGYWTAELAGYWTKALRKRSIWLQDVFVDHRPYRVGSRRRDDQRRKSDHEDGGHRPSRPQWLALRRGRRPRSTSAGPAGRAQRR